MNDQYYIERCKELGKQAADNGNAPVGALIISEKHIIGEAEESSTTKRDITCHAEIEAIRKAVLILDSSDLSNCTMYTTHEPCVMCSYAIRYHKIKRVVYIHSVQYLGGISSDVPLLINTKVPGHWAPPPIIEQYK